MSERRVLVVDDEGPMLRSLERMLGPRYDLRTAGSGGEALGVVDDWEPDLAILDIRMPEMDGFELMGALRERHSGVDVIFMTGAVHELDAQIIRAIRERAFYFIQKPFDRDVLLTLVERCLELRRLSVENRAYVARLESELADARSFQRSLLPPRRAELGGVEVCARYEPCEALGGDFCDATLAGEGAAAALVADVSGHGVSAAMLTALVKSAFHDARAEAYDPTAVVRRVERALQPFDDGRFVTLFCLRTADRGRRLDYVNAGHPAAVLWGPERERELLPLTGPLVSPAFSGLPRQQGRLELHHGDRLLVYSDGLIEARGPEGFYGEERLLAHVEGSDAVGEELLDSLLVDVANHGAGWPADDDRTLMTLRAL